MGSIMKVVANSKLAFSMSLSGHHGSHLWLIGGTICHCARLVKHRWHWYVCSYSQKLEFFLCMVLLSLNVLSEVCLLLQSHSWYSSYQALHVYTENTTPLSVTAETIGTPPADYLFHYYYNYPVLYTIRLKRSGRDKVNNWP